MCGACDNLSRAIDAFIVKSDRHLFDELRKAGYVDIDGTIKDIDVLEKEVAAALKANIRYINGYVNGAVNLDTFAALTWPSIQDFGPFQAAILNAFVKEFKRVLPRFIAAYKTNLRAPNAVAESATVITKWVDDWAPRLTKLMKLSEQDRIGKLLSDALKDGKSVKEFAQTLRDYDIRHSYFTARRAALTEMLRAHSFAANQAIMESPNINAKRWRHTGSRFNKPRPNHVAMDGVTVPKDQPFPLTGKNGGLYLPMYPRDPVLPAAETVNCHCLVQGVVSSEVLGVSDEQLDKWIAEARAELNGSNWEAEYDKRKREKSEEWHRMRREGLEPW